MTTQASGCDSGTPSGQGTQRLGLSAVTLAFGALGFFGSISGALVPAVREAFSLSLSAAMAVQWITLVGVGVSSLPLARLMERIGAVRMVIAALAMSFAGCIAAAAVLTPQIAGDPGYARFLAALLLLSVGATALQLSINPLVVALGQPRFAASRITLAQGVNSLGMLAAVTLTSVLVLARVGETRAAAPGQLLSGIAQTYLACTLFTGVVLLLAIAAFRAGNSASAVSADKTTQSPGGAVRSRWALAGSLAIAAYVGAEGAIGAMLTSFLHQPQIMGISLEVAGFYFAAIYCGGMIAGRFLGGILLRVWQPSRLLAGVAVAAAASCLVAVLGSGTLAAASILLIGPLNAIMFPVIFAITLERSTAPASAVSGLLVLATSGGAVVSAVAGLVGDRIGLDAAFAIPMCAYLIVAAFALRAGQPS